MDNSTLLPKITSRSKAVHPLDAQIIEKAKIRVHRLYLQIKKSGYLDPDTGEKVSGWRGVQISRKLNNVKTAWAFVNENEVPPKHNADYRVKLFLPRVLPSEKKHKQKRDFPVIGIGDWQKYFFKTPKVKWKRK